MAEKKTTKKKTKKTEEQVIRVGNVVELTKDHHCMCADFPAGTKVLVTDLGQKGYSINNNPEHPEDGFEMIECGLEL